MLWPTFLVATAQDWEQKAKEAFERGQLDEARHQAQSALADVSAAAAAHEMLGRIALARRQYSEAVSHFEEARAKGREAPELEKGLASALISLGRHREACSLMERALSRDATQVELRYQLAGSYIAQGRFTEAWPHLEQVYQEGLRHTGVVMQLARARLKIGQDDRAIELLGSLTQATSSPGLLIEVGKLLFERLLYAQALPPLRKAWRQKPGSYDIGMYLALSHYQLKQYAESEGVLAAIQPGTTPPLDYLILLGSVYARLGRWEDSHRELEKAILQAPDRADGYLNLGLFYLERGNQQLAMELLEKGSRMMVPGTKILYSLHARENCNDLAPPQALVKQDTVRGEFYSNLAHVLQKAEHWVSALEVFRLALQVDNLSAAAYGGIGLMCQELGSVEVSRAFLQKGLELHPDAADLHYYLGAIYYELGSFDKAMLSYQKAIELQTPNVPALYLVQLGIAQLAGAREAETQAEASFLRALEIDPNFAQAYYELGKFYLKRKELERAEQSFEKAIHFDPKLLGAYYQYGLACNRNGKPEKGRQLLETFNRRRAMRASSGDGMATNSPVSP